MSAPQPGDKSAGFAGLILGAIALFVIMFGIVRWTNTRFEGHGAAAAPAAAGAPAAAH
ncbi:MAG TPA: hypothetical protein VFS59_07050 [Gemmatimonadaceae bacterium]|nr:hypothetical protein [Gemmatimonadaceae bacterium]